jgi:hypothetical protein
MNRVELKHSPGAIDQYRKKPSRFPILCGMPASIIIFLVLGYSDHSPL